MKLLTLLLHYHKRSIKSPCLEYEPTMCKIIKVRTRPTLTFKLYPEQPNSLILGQNDFSNDWFSSPSIPSYKHVTPISWYMDGKTFLQPCYAFVTSNIHNGCYVVHRLPFESKLTLSKQWNFTLRSMGVCSNFYGKLFFYSTAP